MEFLLLGDAELVALGVLHDVPVKVRDVMSLYESSAQRFGPSPESRGIVVVQVQVKPASTLGGSTTC